MHYQTQLLATDHAGAVLLAVSHSEHMIGGEDPRETGYARLASGNVAQPTSLRDITNEAFPPLPASPSRIAHELRAAKVQSELAMDNNYAANRREEYARNDLRGRHAAALAGINGIRVPRRVFASRNRRALLGFEPCWKEARGEDLPGSLLLIDAGTGVRIGSWESSRTPAKAPGKGAERFVATQVGRPLSISVDGKQVILRNDHVQPLSVAVCHLDEKLSEVGRVSFGQGRFLATDSGWLAVGDDGVTHFDFKLRVQYRAKTPKNAIGWAAQASHQGNVVALPTLDAGGFIVVAEGLAKPRRFHAHPGARRDAFARVCISDCGRWVASRCERELVLTRLEDGLSWPVAELEDLECEDPSHEGYCVRSHVPAGFGFIGSQLMVLEGTGLREIKLADAAASAFVSETGKTSGRKLIRAKPTMSLDELVTAARMSAQAETLRQLYSPPARIKIRALKKAGWANADQKGAPALGASRFGGWPDLPSGCSWPTWEERPMAFLAQLNLAEAHAVEPGLRLPKQGVLSFFLGCSEDSYQKDGDRRERYMVDVMLGTEPGQQQAWKVLFHPQPAALVRTHHAGPTFPELFEPAAVSFLRRGLSLPDENAVVYETFSLSKAERHDYNKLVSCLQQKAQRIDSQLMGYPALLQSTPPELMCELAANGCDPWRFPQAKSEDFRKLAIAASSWTLLLQLTSEGDFVWGDAGHFYFYGDREAMARGDFSRTWVNFEN